MSSRPLHLTPTTGLLLVGTAALLWSFGGTIARFIHAPDGWTIVFWRSYFATVFLLLFMAVQHRPQHHRPFPPHGLARGGGWRLLLHRLHLVRGRPRPRRGSQHPAHAGGRTAVRRLISFLVFREAVSRGTWIAIAAVIAGVAMIVSQSLRPGSLADRRRTRAPHHHLLFHRHRRHPTPHH